MKGRQDMAGITRIEMYYHEPNGVSFWTVRYTSGRRNVYTTGNGGTLPKTVKEFIDKATEKQVKTRTGVETWYEIRKEGEA